MDEMTQADAFRCLGLATDAPPLQVERAFRRKQALFAPGTLATYSLLEEEARQHTLDRLEAAYRLAAAASRDAYRPSVAAPKAPPVEIDPTANPGSFLRARRESVGVSLGEIASRTKIGPMQLAQIEQEQYEKLPAPVYLRGFVVAYARALGLPESEMIAGSFLARQREANGDG